jgi:hypothetical protein
MNTNFTPEQELEILSIVPNFRNQILGVDYLISKFKLKDDIYLKPVYQEIANQIKTPLEEWTTSFNLKNN